MTSLIASLISITIFSVGAVEAGSGENWVIVSYSPQIKNYAVAVVGAKENVYIANSTTAGASYFMRYNTITSGWTYQSTPPQSFKNGTCLAWDKGNYIYTLFGGAYGDEGTTARHHFYRYSISANTWTKMQDTQDTGGQGAGDAITWVPGSVLGVGDNYIYAIVGSAGHGTSFWRYNTSTNSWGSRASPPAGTDDGCSLVWTGSTYIYALRGEFIETSPLYDFWRYDLVNDTWEGKAPIPAYPWGGGAGGINSDFIYALSGNQCYPEPIWDNRLLRITRRREYQKVKKFQKG